MKKNVAEFIYSLNDGGAETLIKNYCKTIDRTRFDIIVIVMYDIGNSAVKGAILELGIPIICVYPHRNILYRGINYLFGKAYVRNRMKHIIKQYSIETIHAHTAVLRYLFYSRSILDQIKLLYTCHSDPERYFSGRLSKEDEAARYLIKHNNLQMIALHDTMANKINDWFNIENTIVVRNGLLLDVYDSSSYVKSEIREKLGIPKDAFVIGHIGRFIEEKNHQLIVKVFGELKKKNTAAFLLLVGDGKLENEIKRTLDNAGLNSHYLILSHRNDIPQLLAIMDVFLFPSKIEGLGIALVEAQVSGLPCVISDRIPKAAVLSKNVSVLKIDDDTVKWADKVVNVSGTTNICDKNKLLQYDLSSQMRILEKYY